LGLATSALYEILTGLPILMGSPSLIIIPFLWLLWHAYRQYNDAAQQWKEVRPKKLVMFLSPSNLKKEENKQFWQDLIAGKQTVEVKTVRAKLKPIAGGYEEPITL